MRPGNGAANGALRAGTHYRSTTLLQALGLPYTASAAGSSR
jgi:hypothetical protein